MQLRLRESNSAAGHAPSVRRGYANPVFSLCYDVYQQNISGSIVDA